MSVYRDNKEWNKWNEMVTASEHATEDFNDFADDAAIIQADKKIQSLKSELEALSACEDCTAQEIEIKELKAKMPKISSYEKGSCTDRICLDGIYFGLVDGEWTRADDQYMARRRYNLGLDHLPDPGKMAANKGRL